MFVNLERMITFETFVLTTKLLQIEKKRKIYLITILIKLLIIVNKFVTNGKN